MVHITMLYMMPTTYMELNLWTFEKILSLDTEKATDSVPFVKSWFQKKARRVTYTRGQVPKNSETEIFLLDMEVLAEPVDAVFYTHTHTHT